MNGDWTITIKMFSESFAGLQTLAANSLEFIKQAKHIQQVETSCAENGSGKPSGYSIEYSCPVEAQIAYYRRRADEMELRLRQGQ